MTYDKYDGRRPARDPRDRFADDRDERDQRGFFERASDGFASWFADDDDGRRPRGAPGEEERFDRQPRSRDESYRRPYTGRPPARDERGSEYRPMTGDYGRAAERGGERGGERERSSFSGTPPTSSRIGDPHYSEWRQRQIDSLDRDYEDYRRENQSRFDSEFSSWRSTREGKRRMLAEVREHMQVVGSDEEAIGTVDKVRGDRIILTRNDSPDGQHHTLNCAMVDRVEGDRVILDKKAEDARRSLGSEERDRALFERDDEREPGAHILNRSFSGTY